ncbi:MAG: aminotransferase class I/II-fold pyridoxal phosphate-dependent enzyme [Geminicoccaceae bacterium]
MINARLDQLGEFPFRRLAATLAREPAPVAVGPADLSLGEPKHAPPELLAATVAANAHLWNRYPPVVGTPEFRAAVAAWLCRRYALLPTALEPDRHVLPLAGSKEGLFSLASLVPETRGGRRAAVLMPDPVYAVYLGAAVMSGAEAIALPATAATGFLPDLDALSPDLLARTSLFYLCTPANPQGRIADEAYLSRAIGLARRHGFVLLVDECYSEIWDREAPPGALAVALADGGDFSNVLVMNSLSKRSSAAGLRSAFATGDPKLIAAFAKLRAYGAAVQPLPLMAAATALWSDEAHVVANRDRYRDKVDLAERRLGNRFGFYRPPGGFFLWLDVGDGETAARRLWREAGLRVLPGAYLAADAEGASGRPYVRVALVDEAPAVDAALGLLADVLDH